MAGRRKTEVEDQIMLLVESIDSSGDSESSESNEEVEDLFEDESIVEDFGEIDWTNQVNMDLFTPSEEIVFGAGPVHDLPSGSTPLQFLKLFFTNDVCEAFKLNINKHAELTQKLKKSVDSHWNPIENVQELWRFFAIIMIFGIVQVPKLRDYWSTNEIIGNQAVKKLMSLNRFQKILHYFYIADSDFEESENYASFIQSIQAVMDDIKGQFLRHFKPPGKLLVNEAFIKNKRSSKVLQHSPLKSSRRGLKIWTLSSPTGYVFNFDVYSGKGNKSKKGLGYDAVNRLMSPIDSKGHHIYMEQVFTSVPLVIDAYKSGNHVCGAIKAKRKLLPKELKTLKLNEFGDHRVFQCIQCPDMLCCVWYDNEQLCVISTTSNLELAETRIRQGPHAVSVTCPSVIADYKAYLGGIQQQLRARNYRNRFIKSSKWWRYLFWFLFDSCLNNAFIVYTLSNMPQNRSPKKLLDFKLDVIEEITNRVVIKPLRNRNLNLPSSSAGPSGRPDASPEPSQAVIHQRVKIKGRNKTCKRCTKLKRKTVANYYITSSFKCSICEICLCVSCFGPYHSENQMQFT